MSVSETAQTQSLHIPSKLRRFVDSTGTKKSFEEKRATKRAKKTKHYACAPIGIAVS